MLSVWIVIALAAEGVSGMGRLMSEYIFHVDTISDVGSRVYWLRVSG